MHDRDTVRHCPRRGSMWKGKASQSLYSKGRQELRPGVESLLYCLLHFPRSKTALKKQSQLKVGLHILCMSCIFAIRTGAVLRNSVRPELVQEGALGSTIITGLPGSYMPDQHPLMLWHCAALLHRELSCLTALRGDCSRSER